LTPTVAVWVYKASCVKRQSARMSKITNRGLTLHSGTGRFIAVRYGNSGRQRVWFLGGYFSLTIERFVISEMTTQHTRHQM